MKRKIMAVTVFIIVFGAVVYTAVLPAKEATVDAVENHLVAAKSISRSVLMVSPVVKPLSIRLEEGVVLTPEERGVITAEVSGLLTEWLVQEHDYVEKGHPVAKLDATDYEIQLSETEATRASLAVRLAQAVKDYNRMEQLVKKEAVSVQSLDNAETEMNALKQQIVAMGNSIRLVKRNINRCIVKAPFSGVITGKNVPPGKFINTQLPNEGEIATIEKTDRLKVFMNLSEMYFREVSEQGAVSCYIPALNRTVTGRIASKNPVINTMKQFSIIFYVENNDRTIPAGVYALATLNTAERERIIVPPTAVKITGNNTGEVYDTGDGKVVSHKIVTGLSFEDGMEVIGTVPEMIIKDVKGVNPGESITPVKG